MILIIINESECVLMVTFKQQTRKQHYYPRFLLKYFANSDNKINAYVRYKDKFLTVNYKNVCCRRNAYETDEVDNKLENKLSKYEEKMSIILNDLFLNNFNEPSSEIKEFIMKFIILQYYRTDYGRLVFINHLTDTFNNTHTLNPIDYHVNPFTQIDIENESNKIKCFNDLFIQYDFRFVNGAFITKKRNHYAKLRARLQAKGTKSAKRRLRSLSGRESRWMSDVNHQLSKTLVETYGKQTLFVLEDLTGVTFDTVHSRRKEHRFEHHSWSFYDLEQKLRYKAHLNESEVVLVDAHYTSQRCPKCGSIDKSNRHKDIHQYACSNCGYLSNDDRVGAMNIYELGKWFVSGIDKPSFVISNE